MRKQRNDSYDRSYDEGYIRPGHGEYNRREKYPVYLDSRDPDSDLDDDDFQYEYDEE